MGKKADDRREREEVLVQQILAFLYTGLGKGAESGGGGKGETPHGFIGPPAAVLPGLPLRFLNPLACSKLYYFLLLHNLIFYNIFLGAKV
jgi:hypothetical protein